MAGLFIFQCLETENNYIGVSKDENKALEATIDLLDQKAHFSKDLQDEWSKYGRQAFELGCPVHIEDTEENIERRLEEALTDWKNILENVAYLGKIDERTGEIIHD